MYLPSGTRWLATHGMANLFLDWLLPPNRKARTWPSRFGRSSFPGPPCRRSAIDTSAVSRPSGATAWGLWGIVHIGLMLGVKNRVATLLNWSWSYLKFGGGIRLITGDKG